MKRIESYTIKPPDSINVHRVRVYQWGDRKIRLSRTMDAVPPCFEAYEFRQDVPCPAISVRIKVDDKEHWGDGLRWPQAEKKLEQALRAQTT